MKTLLHNHTSPETAYRVDDYPYGFRLRCQIRYWLEHKKGHGRRLVSQTTNPKRGNVWNQPKASTYSQGFAIMYLNAEGHVKWQCADPYHCLGRLAQMRLDFAGQFTPEEIADMDKWEAAYRQRFTAEALEFDRLQRGYGLLPAVPQSDNPVTQGLIAASEPINA